MVVVIVEAAKSTRNAFTVKAHLRSQSNKVGKFKPRVNIIGYQKLEVQYYFSSCANIIHI